MNEFIKHSIGLHQTNGKTISSSRELLECVGSDDKRLFVFNISDKGKATPATIHCQSSIIDIDFSTESNHLLIGLKNTAVFYYLHSLYDNISDFVLFLCIQIKILRFSNTDTNILTSPEERFYEDIETVQLVKFNEFSKNLFTAATANHVKVVDFEYSKVFRELKDYKNIVQSFSWNASESQIVTNTKNKSIQITDIRAPGTELSAPSHQGVRDVRVVWLSNENYIISSGKFLC